MDKTTKDVAVADVAAEFGVSDDGAGVPGRFHRRIFRIRIESAAAVRKRPLFSPGGKPRHDGPAWFGA
jgi:hypothetical protein